MSSSTNISDLMIPQSKQRLCYSKWINSFSMSLVLRWSVFDAPQCSSSIHKLCIVRITNTYLIAEYIVHIYVRIMAKFIYECVLCIHISIVNNNHANETTIPFLIYFYYIFYFMGGGSWSFRTFAFFVFQIDSNVYVGILVSILLVLYFLTILESVPFAWNFNRMED